MDARQTSLAKAFHLPGRTAERCCLGSLRVCLANSTSFSGNDGRKVHQPATQNFSLNIDSAEAATVV